MLLLSSTLDASVISQSSRLLAPAARSEGPGVCPAHPKRTATDHALRHRGFSRLSHLPCLSRVHQVPTNMTAEQLRPRRRRSRPKASRLAERLSERRRRRGLEDDDDDDDAERELLLPRRRRLGEGERPRAMR